MSVITLLTDFGLQDEYVGVMKGVIAGICNEARVIDITHGIAPQNVLQAAWVLESAWRYFPAGSIHLIVVDPGVGSSRAIVGARAEGHCFIAPDNGVLSPVFDAGRVDRLVRIENSNFFLDTVSSTFHGRDIFAPVAAHLAGGLPLVELGTEIAPSDAVRLTNWQSISSRPGEIQGRVVSVDRFGNLITNISRKQLDALIGTAPGREVEIRVGNGRIVGLSPNYFSGKGLRALAVIGSRGMLEVAVYCDHAGQVLSAGSGDLVRLKLV